MKPHLGWIRLAAAAAIMAGGPQAVAQYAPYRPIPQTPPAPATATTATPAATQPQQAVAPAGQPATQPTYMAYRPQTPSQTATPYRAPAVATYPQTTTPQAAATTAPQTGTTYPQATYPHTGTTYPQTAAAYPQTATYPATYPQTASRYSTTTGPYTPYPSYGSVAQSEVLTPEPAANGTIPAPQANGPTNGSATNGAVNGHDMHNGRDMHHGHEMTNGVELHNGMAAPHGNGHNGYPVAGGPNGTGMAPGCHGETTGTQGGYFDYGLSSYFDNPYHDAQWFGGVYFLWMERDSASPVKLTARVDHTTASDPYYPQGDTTVLSTHQTDFDYREGVEVRFGSSFTIGSACDAGSASGCGTGYGYGYNGYGNCGTCAPACPDVYAWEVVWWGLDDDSQQAVYVDPVATLADQTRIYGMVNFVGLEYDRDAGATWGYLPVNDFYGYGLPIPTPPAPPAVDGYVVVSAQRVRQNFDAQNLELNIIRFPICGTSCSGAGGCNAGGCGDYGYGAYGNGGCETDCCPSAFSMYGSCGVRYFRADDDFWYASEYGQYLATVLEPGEIYYAIDVENHLVGAQLGWTMNYCYGGKWNFFANSTFGMFNNHINHYQRVYGDADGTVRDVQTGREFRVRSDKDDIAFLGELRLGGSYDITCNWRAVAAYRAVAVTGVATSTDQIPSDFSNQEYVAIIDSDSSMIVHGLQVGAECRY